MRKLWQTSKVTIREESIKSMKSRTPKGLTLCVQGGGTSKNWS